MIKYNNTLDALKSILSYADYDVLTGFGLSYQDYMDGLAINSKIPVERCIMISHEGFNVARKYENSEAMTVSEGATIFIQTNDNILKVVESLIKQVQGVGFTCNDKIKHIDINNCYPEKNGFGNTIFIMEILINYGV